MTAGQDKTERKTRWLPLVLAACAALTFLAVMPAFAQRGGGPPSGGGGGGARGGQGPGGGNGGPGMNGGGSGSMPGGIPSGPGGGRGGESGRSSRTEGLRGRSQFGPVGRWWDDKNFARSLNIRPDQKQRMDAIFNANRSDLSARYQELKTQEGKLQDATRETQVNGGSVFTQIDRVAQAREALGAANGRMTDALRKELDAEQIAKLQSLNK